MNKKIYLRGFLVICVIIFLLGFFADGSWIPMTILGLAILCLIGFTDAIFKYPLLIKNKKIRRLGGQ